MTIRSSFGPALDGFLSRLQLRSMESSQLEHPNGIVVGDHLADSDIVGNEDRLVPQMIATKRKSSVLRYFRREHSISSKQSRQTPTTSGGEDNATFISQTSMTIHGTKKTTAPKHSRLRKVQRTWSGQWSLRRENEQKENLGQNGSHYSRAKPNKLAILSTKGGGGGDRDHWWSTLESSTRNRGFRPESRGGLHGDGGGRYPVMDQGAKMVVNESRSKPFDPRKDVSMSFTEKIGLWRERCELALEGGRRDYNHHHVRHSIFSQKSGTNENEGRRRKYYPGTASAEFSDFSNTSRGREERKARVTTRQVIEQHRAEAEVPRRPETVQCSRSRCSYGTRRTYMSPTMPSSMLLVNEYGGGLRRY